jgi:pyridoxal phosphate enzyme (YggS family)
MIGILMLNIVDNLHIVQARIRDAENRYGRLPGSVALIAVSKKQTPNAIATAAAAGQCHFGENYVQEALTKMQDLADLELHWHFIGPIQSNKTRYIAERFSWVHSVDRLKVAQRLNKQRPMSLPPLNICLQVNISNESTKNGMHIADMFSVASAVSELPRLRLRGLMAVPALSDTFEQQRRPFAQLRELQEKLAASGLAMDTLSMGMSADLEAAIAEGTTLIRVGTAIFGPRL